ncbi:hypothetical protein EJA71_01720 [Pseudomonas sp. PB106]|nr:hypothetical protein EJA71_01720 [Pseudomonas sp. PB106]
MDVLLQLPQSLEPGPDRSGLLQHSLTHYRPIVPTLRVGMPPWTLRVHCDAERHGMHSHAERGNDLNPIFLRGFTG